MGTDTFTYAAFDGSKNSNIATATVTVAQGPFSITATAQVPPSYPAGWPVAFAVVPSVTNATATPSFDWNFGDGTAHGTGQFPAHTYATAGSYPWSVVVSVAGATTTVSGMIAISQAVVVAVGHDPVSNTVTLSWPNTTADTLLETSDSLGVTSPWQWLPTQPTLNGNTLSITVPATGKQFFRVSRPW